MFYTSFPRYILFYCLMFVNTVIRLHSSFFGTRMCDKSSSTYVVRFALISPQRQVERAETHTIVFQFRQIRLIASTQIMRTTHYRTFTTRRWCFHPFSRVTFARTTGTYATFSYRHLLVRSSTFSSYTSYTRIMIIDDL